MTKINMQNQPEFGKQLVAIIERIEKLNEDAEQIAADIKCVYDEAKSSGYDVKMVRKMVALRKLDPDERDETDELTQMYRTAIGL